LNHLINSNLKELNNTNKVIYFDTTFSFSSPNECVIYKEIEELRDISNFLNESISLNTIKDVRFIFIDGLTIIASRLILSKKENEVKLEFNKTINFCVNKYNIGVIFTTNPFKGKVRKTLDFIGRKDVKLRDSESNLTNNIILPVDYTLFFYVPHFSYRRYQLSKRRFLLKLKREKYHSIDEIVENIII
jgi:hypothetical protein